MSTTVTRWIARVMGTAVLPAAVTTAIAAAPASAQQPPPPAGYTLEGNYPTYAACLFAGNAYYPDLFQCIYGTPYWYLYVALPT